MIEAINKMVRAIQNEYRDRVSVPPGVIGSGYSGAIGAILMVLGNPLYFGRRDKPTRVHILNPQSIFIEGTGSGLHKVWANMARAWESDDVLWAFNFIRNDIVKETDTFFLLCYEKLSDLQSLSLLWPYSKFLKYKLLCEEFVFEGESFNGQLITPGSWCKAKSQEVDFQIKLTMDPRWFPNESFNRQALKEMIFRRELFAEVHDEK